MIKKNEPIEAIEELPEEVEGEETDWKALALKNQGIAKRLKTKLEKKDEEKPEVKPVKKKSVTKKQKVLTMVSWLTSKAKGLPTRKTKSIYLQK